MKYDFHADNGIGNDDHSDGESYEYVRGKVKYVPRMMAFGPDGKLYLVDMLGSRVLRVDPS